MNSKEKSLKYVHLLVIVLGIALYIISLVQHSASLPRIVLIRLLVNIVALIFGFVYAIINYKKDAAKYYKVFMWLLVISEVIENTSILSTNTLSTADIFKNNINLVLFTLIAGAKDYGKNNSYLLCLCLVVFNVYALFDVVSIISTSGRAVISNIDVLDRIGQLLLALTTSFMVCGKYIDKDSRGSK